MNQTHIRISLWMTALALSVFAISAAAETQTAATKQQPTVDFALTFAADRTNAVDYAGQWLSGGSAELGAEAWHGLGIAARVTGLTTSSIGSQSVPLNLVITTFGPRYRFSHLTHAGRGLSIYGEGLIGEANGFKSVFPAAGAAANSSNALALQVGGGCDYILKSKFGLRLVEANWTRTQFPNANTNVQNHLQLGTGILLRF